MKAGRNKNTNTVARVERVTINSAAATTIAPVNPDRMYFSACLAPETTDRDVAVRLYPAATDSAVTGEILTRRFTGNDSALRNNWQMPVDVIYTGEISAIAVTGTFDLIVTEY